MLVLPVVARELLIQARRKSTYWIRVAASAVAGFLMLWILLIGAAPIPTVSQGRTLFSILSTLAFSYCLGIGALVTADCLSAEKRDGTIGLLFLTDLRGYDVVVGKLVSSSIHCAYGLLAVVPMMSMALLFGGVTAGEVARTALVLGNTLFFSLSAGMLVSTLSRNERRAVFGAVLLILIVAAGPYELGYLLANNFAQRTAFNVAEAVLSPSPVYAFSLVQSTAGALPTSALYRSLAQTHALAWALLGLACAIVPHTWKDRPKGRRRERWSQWWRRWTLGNASARAAFRRRLLERNPCFWLSSRERHKAVLVWVLIAGLAAVGLWICTNHSLVFYETSVVLLFILQVLLKIWFTAETCQRWIEDRQSGALELLLCAPLQTRDLIRGQGMALRRQFGWPVVVTLGLTLSAWVVIVRQSGYGSNTEFGRTWLLMSLVALLADLAALRWVGAWLGLTARGLNRAIGGSIVRVLWLRWFIYLACAEGASAWEWVGLGHIPLLREEPFWLVPAVSLDLVLGWSARRKFLRYFRALAANPSDYRGAVRMTASEAAPRAEPTQQPGRSQVEAGRLSHAAKWTVLALLVLVVAGLPSGCRYWLKRQVNRRIAAVEQAGFPVTIDEFNRRRPPLTNGVNAAEVLERATPGIVMWWALSPDVQANLPGFRAAFPARTGPLPAAMKAAMKSFLSANQSALEILHAAPPLSTGRYAIDWTTGGSRYVAQSQSMWLFTSLLQYEVFLRADERDVVGALDSLRRLWELGRSLDHEPGSMQRMRTTCFYKGFIALEWLLTRGTVSDAELRAIQKDLDAAKGGADLLQALVGVRCLAMDWYRSPPPSAAYGGPGTPGTIEYYQVQLRNHIYELTGARDREFAAYLDAMNEFTRAMRAPLPERYYAARAIAAKQPRANPRGSPSATFTPQFMFDSMIDPDAEFEARCRAAVIGVAIERFRLRHPGRLPDRLSELVPEFIPEIPRDPFDGQPMRYKRLPKGYCVYSVDRNGKDDGGVEPSISRQGRPGTLDGDITFSVER
ncbi:MAG: ABC transporter permease [Limisphaerales bacterium]